MQCQLDLAVLLFKPYKVNVTKKIYIYREKEREKGGGGGGKGDENEKAI
jgi:hypothetical protein